MIFLATRQQLGDGRRAGSMRQAAEHAIGPLGNYIGREIFELQMEPAGERRMDFTDRRRFGFPRRERGDLDFRMAQQNANQLER